MKNRRQFKGLASGAELRSASFRGREHIVVPIVALVEGVIHASNAAVPELALASEFGAVPLAWNGRPVVLNHPSENGQQVSANSPAILEQYGMGFVFNATVEDKKLKVEAWLDPAMVTAAGGDETLERLRAGEQVEVSVGVFVEEEPTKGVHAASGKSYGAIWRGVLPDHLAILPTGIGACSIEMGCGAPRAAEGATMKTLKERLEAVKAFWASLRAGEDVEGQSDQDIRRSLDSALFAVVPGYLGIDAVFQDSSTVVYAAAPEGGLQLFQRGFEKDDKGEIKLKDDAAEVKAVTKYETMSGAAAGGCGCGGKQGNDAPTTASQKEDDMKDKKLLVQKILARKKSPFKAEDAAGLEALSEATLVTMADAPEEPDAPAPAPPVAPPAPAPAPEPTPEAQRTAFLSMFPDIKAVLDKDKAQTTARHVQLIAAVKATKQVVYNEQELAAMSVEQLEKVAALAQASVPTTAASFDFSAQLPPRADGEDKKIPAPRSLADALVAKAKLEGSKLVRAS